MPLAMFTSVRSTWLLIIHIHVSMLLGRVESAANVADAPSRQDFSFLLKVNASYRQPVLPGLLRDIYALPDLNAYSR